MGITRGNQGHMNSLVNSFCYLKLFWVLLSPKKNTELVHVSVWETGWDLLFTSVVNLLWLHLNFWAAPLLRSQELVSGWTLSQCSWLCWETQSPYLSLFYLGLWHEVRKNVSDFSNESSYSEEGDSVIW